MAARFVTLDPAPDAFVAEQIASGAYADNQAVLTAALTLMQREQQAEAAKVARFMALVQEGLDDLDAGCFRDRRRPGRLVRPDRGRV